MMNTEYVLTNLAIIIIITIMRSDLKDCPGTSCSPCMSLFFLNQAEMGLYQLQSPQSKWFISNTEAAESDPLTWTNTVIYILFPIQPVIT